MHTYDFVGTHGRVFTALKVGYGVTVRRGEGLDPVAGQTVELHPGDVLTTRDPIDHPELVARPKRAPRMPSSLTPGATPPGVPDATLPEE